MYYNLLPGSKIPCPMPFGRGEHALLLNCDTGELWCRCIHMRQRPIYRTDKISVAFGRLLNNTEADLLYEAWRDEIFRKAIDYAG